MSLEDKSLERNSSDLSAFIESLPDNRKGGLVKLVKAEYCLQEFFRNHPEQTGTLYSGLEDFSRLPLKTGIFTDDDAFVLEAGYSPKYGFISQNRPTTILNIDYKIATAKHTAEEFISSLCSINRSTEEMELHNGLKKIGEEQVSATELASLLKDIQESIKRTLTVMITLFQDKKETGFLFGRPEYALKTARLIARTGGLSDWLESNLQEKGVNSTS